MNKINEICQILDAIINDGFGIQYENNIKESLIIVHKKRSDKEIDINMLVEKLIQYTNKNDDIYIENRGYYGIYIAYNQDKKFEHYFKQEQKIQSSEYKQIFLKEQKIEINQNNIYCIDKISYNNGYIHKDKYKISPILYKTYIILQKMKNDDLLNIAEFRMNYKNNKQPYLVTGKWNQKKYLNINWLQDRLTKMGLYVKQTENEGLYINDTNYHVLNKYFD